MNKKITELILQKKKNFYAAMLNTPQDSNKFLNDVGEKLKHGVDILCFSCLNLEPKDIFEIGNTLRILSAEFEAILLIYDRIDIAKLIGADGVILDSKSIPIVQAKSLTEDSLMLGYYAKSLEEALQAEKKGADFVISENQCELNIPVFRTTKNK